ncbi:MAG: TadE family type IV pilus minor pilin [Nocardioidaceae bacterium]
MVTAETAVVIPVLVVVAVALVWVVGLGIAQVRCLDAAREGARLAARGEPDSAVHAAVERSAPHGSAVTVATEDGEVTVTVSVQAVPDLPLLGGLPGVQLDASATAALEDSGARP